MMFSKLGVEDSVSIEVTRQDRVIRNGKVAILYSSEFGTGWYTWNKDHPGILRDPEIVHLVECRENAPTDERVYYTEKIIDYCKVQYPGVYAGYAENLAIRWLDVGTPFRLIDFDGSEVFEFPDNVDWITA